MGGASSIENGILEGDKLGNFPVNAFAFTVSVHSFWLKFVWSKVMNE